MSNEDIIDKVDLALNRYYQKLNTQYDQQFKSFCGENGIDADLVKDELEGGPESCMLVEFDQENFPFDKEPETEKDKIEFIFDIIKQCYENPDILFDSNLPKIDQQLFQGIGEEEISNIKNIYEKQCPTIYNRGMNKDENLLLMLAIQHMHQMDFLLNLVDTFDRARVNKIDEVADYTLTDWIRDSQHIQKRKNIQIKASQKDATYAEVCKHAIQSFAKRCCDRLIFNAVVKIDDSFERTVKYVYSSASFIKNLIKKSKMSKTNLLPFQMDVVIVEGKPIRTTKTDSIDDKGDSEESDEEDEEDGKEQMQGSGAGGRDGPFVDYVGDIEAKLKKNKLPYVKKQLNIDSDEYKDQRLFGELFQKFKQDNEIKDDSDKYLSHKRVIALIDRRKSKNKDNIDDVYFYPAVSGKYTRDIPKDAVPEWGISASHTCLLPSMKYKQSEAIGEQTTKHLNKTDDEKKENNPSEDINVTTLFHCKGGILTFSFHARSEDKLKMQLYFNGQSMRCLPTDLKNVLPRIFVENDTNKAYKNDKQLDGIIKELETKFIDQEFKAFLQC